MRGLVVAASYDPQSVDVELFVRQEDGESATVLVKNFEPYFYALDVLPGLYQELTQHEDVKRLEWAELTWEGRKQRFLKVILYKPFKTWKVREFCKEMGGRPFAADIVFTNRAFYDLDLSLFVEWSGKEIQDKKYFTQRVWVAKEIAACPPLEIPLRVLSFDMEASQESGPFLICARCDNNRIAISATGTDLIDKLEKVIRELDPDVISGFNIFKYDLPELQKLALLAGQPGLFIGRKLQAAEGRESTSKSYTRAWWNVPGRAVIDTMTEAVKRINPARHSLDYIGKNYLGAGKQVPMNRTQMYKEWNADPARVKKACMEDAELSQTLYDHMRLSDIYKAVGIVGKLPFAAVSTGTTNPPLESLLIREFDRRGHAVPMNKGKDLIQEDEEVGGTFVFKTKPGLYEWVVGLDTRSLYPFVIMNNNICISSYKGRKPSDDTHVVEVWTPDKSDKLFDVCFTKSQRGIVPDVIKRLFDYRMELIAKRDASADEKDRVFYDGLQNAVKVNLLNSTYGLMASNFSRFSNSDMGNAVIWGGRFYTESTIQAVQSEGFEVVIGDTDSLYVRLPVLNLESAIGLAKEIATKHSRANFRLEVEKIYSVLFTHGRKKRYVGQIVWPKEKRDVKGYETRRTDSFPLMTRAMNDAFDSILTKNPEALRLAARDIVRRCLAGDIPLEELIISRSIQKEDDYARPDSMANVQAARKLRARGEVVTWGMKVPYIVVNGTKSPMEVEPFIDGQKFTYQTDYPYYAKRLAKGLARLTEFFGADRDYLLTGQRKLGMFDATIGDDEESEEDG
jgi:DNA polymerase I